MARPRTPTNVLEMRGAFKKDPQRRRARENEPIVYEPAGGPPDNFTDDQKKAWTDIQSRCPAGVMTKSDEIALEIAAGLLARHRLMPLTGTDLSQLNQLIGKFGMTPSERSKVTVSVPSQKAGNRFGTLD